MAYFFPPPLEIIENEAVNEICEKIVATIADDYSTKERVKNFVNVTVSRFSFDEFRMHFRLSPSGFQILLNKLNSVRNVVDLKKKLLLFLRYVGTQETLESLTIQFDVSFSSAWRILRQVHDLMKDSNFLSEMIRLPERDFFPQLAKEFQSLSGRRFPPIFVGAIDCKEVSILKPKDSPDSYFNRKSFFSVKLQATVDAKANFIDVFIGWPGRTNDARVFLNSPLHQACVDGYLNDFMIMGDSAYPCSNFVCTPFKRNRRLSQDEKTFNKTFSGVRQIVECAFGRTTERWRRLKFIYMHSLNDICNVIHACCALHNFCQQTSEIPFAFDEEVDSDGEECNGSDLPLPQRSEILRYMSASRFV